MKWVSIVLFLMLCGLQYNLWFGYRSWDEVLRLETEVKAQNEANLVLEVRNQTLAAEVADLQEGDEAIAEIARTDLGYIGAGEFYYRILPADAVASDAVQTVVSPVSAGAVATP